MRPGLAVLSVIVSIGLIKILTLTFGTAFESMRIKFVALTPTLTLSPEWKVICLTGANNFNLLFDAILPIIVALIVYAVLVIISNKDYDRPATFY